MSGSHCVTHCLICTCHSEQINEMKKWNEVSNRMVLWSHHLQTCWKCVCSISWWVGILFGKTITTPTLTASFQDNWARWYQNVKLSWIMQQQEVMEVAVVTNGILWRAKPRSIYHCHQNTTQYFLHATYPTSQECQSTEAKLGEKEFKYDKNIITCSTSQPTSIWSSARSCMGTLQIESSWISICQVIPPDWQVIVRIYRCMCFLVCA